jgi:hypothetical protein
MTEVRVIQVQTAGRLVVACRTVNVRLPAERPEREEGHTKADGQDLAHWRSLPETGRNTKPRFAQR